MTLEKLLELRERIEKALALAAHMPDVRMELLHAQAKLSFLIARRRGR